MSNYVTLETTGTMDQSFHFQVTPQKRGGPCMMAENGNCMLNVEQGQSTPGGSVRTSELGCPDLKKFCCPKGYIGRPKVPLFEFGPVYSNPEPWYPCFSEAKATEQIPGVYYNPNAIEWTNSCRIKGWKPPVF